LDFGSHLVAGGTGVFLHNRGLGFSLEPGHIAELTAGRRPPHTLSPALVTRRDGSLSHLVGTMGGDAQPQIIMQLLARLLGQGAEPRQALAAPRFALDAPSAGPFRLWFGHDLQVRLEGHAPGGALRALADRGHRVTELDAFEAVSVGHAHIISTERVKSSHRIMHGASDPRSLESDAIGC
jgi:gamma-glutamyltranspeptidase/glutathione hydrolase